MARELEALKSQTQDEGGVTKSPSTADLGHNPPESGLGYSGVAVVDDSGLIPSVFQLGAFSLDKDVVIDCFKM